MHSGMTVVYRLAYFRPWSFCTNSSQFYIKLQSIMIRFRERRTEIGTVTAEIRICKQMKYMEIEYCTYCN